MQIDVFQDTVCPFCRIGKKHLELALAQWDGEPVNVRYRAFYLNPSIPPAGYEFAPYMLAKGGGRMRLEDFFDAPRKMGEAVGLTFNFEQITRAPNTELSHRLIALTPDDRRQEVIDAIYAAYFEFGRDIGDLDVLLETASECGLDATDLRPLLEGDAARAEVEEDVEWARQAGISGVPFFVVNSQYAFSGAQPPETIIRVMKQVLAEASRPAETRPLSS